MAKYLTEQEAKTLTGWIDSISRNRELDYDPYLDAARTDSDFDISGKGDNPAWDAAPEHIICPGPHAACSIGRSGPVTPG